MSKKCRHPEPSLFEGVRVSSFVFFYKIFKRWDSHVAKYAPQNDGEGRWDSHVVRLDSFSQAIYFNYLFIYHTP